MPLYLPLWMRDQGATMSAMLALLGLKEQFANLDAWKMQQLEHSLSEAPMPDGVFSICSFYL